MKKTTFILIFLCFSKLNFAQTKITTLDFPYNKDYVLELAGVDTVFDIEGNVYKKNTPAALYTITEQTKTKDKNLTTFMLRQVLGTDTITIKSKLLLNSKGMWVWFEDSAVQNEKKALAISLPLVAGKKWETQSPEGKISCICKSMDTIISVPAGAFHCFEIDTKMEGTKTESYEQYMIIKEFYNQQIGKVAYHAYGYLYVYATKKTFTVYKEEEGLINYSGYKKN